MNRPPFILIHPLHTFQSSLDSFRFHKTSFSVLYLQKQCCLPTISGFLYACDPLAHSTPKHNFSMTCPGAFVWCTLKRVCFGAFGVAYLSFCPDTLISFGSWKLCTLVHIHLIELKRSSRKRKAEKSLLKFEPSFGLTCFYVQDGV